MLKRGRVSTSLARPPAQLPPTPTTPARRENTVRPFVLSQGTLSRTGKSSLDPDPNIRTQLEREYSPGGYNEC